MHQLDLKKLLNDESFIHWLEDRATVSEQQKWNHWMMDDPQSLSILRESRKIVSMPFVEEKSTDVEKELRALRKEI